MRKRKVLTGGDPKKPLDMNDLVEMRNITLNVGYDGTDEADTKVINLIWPPDDWLEMGAGNAKLVISDRLLTEQELGTALDKMACTVAKRLVEMADDDPRKHTLGGKVKKATGK